MNRAACVVLASASLFATKDGHAQVSATVKTIGYGILEYDRSAGTQTSIPAGMDITACALAAGPNPSWPCLARLAHTRDAIDLTLSTTAQTNRLTGLSAAQRGQIELTLTAPAPIDVTIDVFVLASLHVASQDCRCDILTVPVASYEFGACVQAGPLPWVYFTGCTARFTGRIDATGLRVQLSAAASWAGGPAGATSGSSLVRATVRPDPCVIAIGGGCGASLLGYTELTTGLHRVEVRDASAPGGIGVVLVGVQPASLPTPFGCPLLLAIAADAPITLDATGLTSFAVASPSIRLLAQAATLGSVVQLTNAIDLNCP